MSRTYTDQERSEALGFYEEVGAADAARLCDFVVSAGTIRQWAHRAGMSRYSAEKTQAATEATRRRASERRAELQELLLSRAIDMLLRMDETHKDFRGKDAVAVFWDKAPAGAAKDYATAAAILLDKYRLEMGEHTDRTQMITIGAVDEAIERLTVQLGHDPSAD